MGKRAHVDLQDESLESLSDAVRYRAWLSGLAEPFLGDRPIEIGGGNGDYAEAWSSPGRRIVVTESDARRRQRLAARFNGHDSIEVAALTLPAVDRSMEHRFTAAVAYNVLEHIRHDVDALRSMAALVHPGGHIVLIVPAFQFALGHFDRLVGHHRRYTRRSLADVAAAADLEVVELRYINPIGLLAWLVAVKLLRRVPRPGPAVRLYDRVIVPPSRRLDARFRIPFGQSVFTVLRVRDRSGDQAP